MISYVEYIYSSTTDTYRGLNLWELNYKVLCEISSSHGGEYDVQSCLSLMMEAVRTSETSVDNHFTRQYNPEDSSEHQGTSLLIFYLSLLSV
jgi:hypothetical protein